MTSEEITIKAKDGGEFMAYLARPDGGSGPGLVVIQEIFGVNEVMREITDSFAAAGFVAVCPDIFWRQEPGIQLTDKTEAEWERAFELFNGFSLDNGMEDLDATVEHARDLEGCTGKVGAVGYCLGGRLAFLTATRTGVDAAVGYYGVMIDQHADEPLRAPVLLHVATEDSFVPKETQKAMHDALDDNPKATLYDYEGNEHAFARVGGDHYDADAAATAQQRTLAFFKEHLG